MSRSEEYGETRCVYFKQKQVESRSSFRQRRFFLRFLGNNEPSFSFPDPTNSAKSLLDGKRDYSLVEAKSEVQKHESRADYFDGPVRHLQRQLDSNRLKIYCTNQDYEESRKEQARLHEELAQRERALRETQISSIHEVEELKSAQEMRVDEFSAHNLRESHVTTLELTSQVQELQESVNCLNDSREFQDME